MLSLIALLGAVPLAMSQASGSTVPMFDPAKHDKSVNSWPNAVPNVVYRNVVTDFGAPTSDQGDATEAFLAAINSTTQKGVNGRCVGPLAIGGPTCQSSTLTPALVFVPPGTYTITSTLMLDYQTQFVGDPANPPILKIGAMSDPNSLFAIDTDIYIPGAYGAEYYMSVNNFYRQIRNFVIDMTDAAPNITGLHWQVAQATSLQNIKFKMIPNSAQVGIHGEDGSGGFMTDLSFSGGNIGLDIGSQQYTMRNMVFDGCTTAINLAFSWGWLFHGLQITNAKYGINMTSSNPKLSSVGSAVVLDSSIDASVAGILTAYDPAEAGIVCDQYNASSNTLIADNVTFVSQGISNILNTGKSSDYKPATQGQLLLQGAQISGPTVDYPSDSNHGNQQHVEMRDSTADPLRPHGGSVFTRSRPQYETEQSIMFSDDTCKGVKDGKQDASSCIQNAMNAAAAANKVLYVNYGAYRIMCSITVPDGLKMTGEMWPIFLVDGASFSNQHDPQPVFIVGKEGDSQGVEMSDFIFSTLGPAPGAIIMQWNINAATPGASGLWDVHWRIGGAAGTNLQVADCNMNFTQDATQIAKCQGAYLSFWAPACSGNIYMENVWNWVADHDQDDQVKNGKLSIYNGRGILIESTKGPVWMWGTASEHSVLYNYNIAGAKDVFMGLTQTETPYFQPQTPASAPFDVNATMFDPTFGLCDTTSAGGVSCKDSWALMISDSSNIQLYGLGFYSFFNDYSQECVLSQNCQENIISVDSKSTGVVMYGLNTIASVNMVTYNNQPAVVAADYYAYKASTLARWRSPDMASK